MWILNFIPDALLSWTINLALLIGGVLLILGFVTKFIPLLGSKAQLARIIGIVILIPALYFKGGYGVEQFYQSKIAELNEKIELAEKESADLNAQIETQVITVTKEIESDTAETKYLIESMKEQINKGCELSEEAVNLYNKAIKGKE
jgi:hypothetical protein|tara:strand:- start:375 stop:815 length:441 start_codon:yes stop_codon:yes gene_type:complete